MLNAVWLPSKAEGNSFNVKTHGSENYCSSDSIGMGNYGTDVYAQVVVGIRVGVNASLAHDFDDVVRLEVSVAGDLPEDSDGATGRDLEE